MFIVQRLACFDTPTEVAVAVKEEYGIVIDRNHIGIYDPTTQKGSQLGKKFKDIFDLTRKSLLEDKSVIPIANKTYRLRALNKMYERVISKKNDVLAMEILEQAAKETGDFYTNKTKLADKGESPWIAFYQQINGSSIPIVQDVDLIEDVEFEDQTIDFNKKVEASETVVNPKAKTKIIAGRD